MNTRYRLLFLLLLLCCSAQHLKAQKIPEDYRWGSSDFQKVINSHDDGFITLSASRGNYQKHTVIKINGEGELVYRYEADPEKMFKRFMKNGETWFDRNLFELSNGNVAVWFSAAKDNRCPVDLYYYILNPQGQLLQASTVPFARNYKNIDNPKLDNIVMVNDNEAIISVSHGPSCKEIINNSPMNKTVLYNLSTGDIKPLNELDGHKVMSCVAEKGYVYLLTLPIRFYRNDNGVKEYREMENRQFRLWKMNSNYEVQTSQGYHDLWEGAIIPKMKLEEKNIRLFYCWQTYNEVEFGYKLLDKGSLLQRNVKVYRAKLFEQDPYAEPDKYFMYGSTIISDASGENMILFSLEPWKKGQTDSKNIYAAVVIEGVLRNDSKILALGEQYDLAVSQVNNKGKYLMITPRHTFIGNFNDEPLPVIYENANAVMKLKEKLVKEKMVAPGSLVVVNDIAPEDKYYSSKSELVGKTFKAGRYLMRYGDASYTGYLMDATGAELFFYNIKLSYPKQKLLSSKGISAAAPRNKAFKIENFSKVYDTNRGQQSYQYALPELKLALKDEVLIEKMGMILNLAPKDVPDEVAAQWKAYILAEYGVFYIVWVPKDENKHVDEKYQPANEDGFIFFYHK